MLGAGQCRSAQRDAEQPAADLHAQHQRPAAQARRLQAILIVAYRNGSPVRIRDIGNAIEGTGKRSASPAGTTSKRAIILGGPAPARRQRDRDGRPHQGAAAAAAGVHCRPPIKVNIVSDRTQTIRASVDDVQFTLMLTVALVVMVIFLFLRNFWATVIPGRHGAAVADRHFRGALRARLQPRQPVAHGAVDRGRLRGRRRRRRDREHRPPSRGRPEPDGGRARRARGEIGFTIVSITLSLIAVFIPLFLMGGYVGKLFQEFAVTRQRLARPLAGRSRCTLTPMLCARLLKPRPTSGTDGSTGVSERGFDGLLGAL